jgi:hypothetical protein
LFVHLHVLCRQLVGLPKHESLHQALQLRCGSDHRIGRQGADFQ